MMHANFLVPARGPRAAVPAVLAIAILLLIAPAGALAAPEGSPQGFQRYETHGVTLLIKAGTSADTGSVFGVMRAGTGDQLPGETHCAHVAEHTVFRNPLPGSAVSLAGRVGIWKGLYNGWTGPDHTQFELSVPHRYVPEAAGLLMQALFPAAIAEPQYAAELEGRLRPELAYMTTNELSAPLNALRLMLLAGTVYDEPLFTTPVGEVGRDKVLGYMQREYSPRRLLLVVVADVDAAEVVSAVERELGSVPPGEPPETRQTALEPLPPQELALPDPGRGLVLAGLGFGNVTEGDLPYLHLASILLTGRLSEGVPPGLEPDPQLQGPIPVQGAACMMAGYRPGSGAAGDPIQLAAEAMAHVRASLQQLPETVTVAAVANLLQAATADPGETPELPAGVPVSLYEAYIAGIATVPGVGVGLGDHFAGADAAETRARMLAVLSRYLGEAKLTAVVTAARRAPWLPWAWVGGGAVVVAGVLAVVRRRRGRSPAGMVGPAPNTD